MSNYSDFLRTVRDDAAAWEMAAALTTPSKRTETVSHLAKKIVTELHQKTTQEDVRKLVNMVNVKSPKQLQETLSALGELKEKVTHAINQLLPEGETAKQQNRLSIALVGEIEKHIMHLGQALQQMPSEPKIAKRIATREDELQMEPLEATAFEAASQLLQRPMPKSTFAALEDTHFDTVWKDVLHGEDARFFIKPKIREDVDDPTLIPKKLIDYELAERKDPKYQPDALIDKNGRPVPVPRQFGLDFKRTNYFLLNGKIEYNNHEKFRYNEAESYLALKKACLEQGGQKLLDRVECLVHQGLQADMLAKIQAVHSPDKQNPYFGRAISQYWGVDIQEDKLIITCKFCYTLKDPSAHKDPERGSVIGKRVMEIPIASLLKGDYEGITCSDTYSQLIKSPAYAEAILLAF